MFVCDAVGCWVNLARCDWVDAMPCDEGFTVACGTYVTTTAPGVPADRKCCAILRTFASLPEAGTYLRSLFVPRHPYSLEPSCN